MRLEQKLQNMIGIIAICIALLATVANSIPNDEFVWARCVYNGAVKPCKLVNDKVYINGKEVDIQMVDVIAIDGVTNFK
jgi:anaerobic glycerol-3-phosphate dehydrogenase